MYSQQPLRYRRGVIANRTPPTVPTFHVIPSSPGLVPGADPPDQAPVHSVPISEVATSEQLSSLNIPKATSPPAPITLATSTNNAVNPTNLPGKPASIRTAEPDPTNLAPGKTQPASHSRGATSPALPAMSEDRTVVGNPKTHKPPLSPTSEHGPPVSGTDQTSMPPTIIPTTAPAIPTVIGSAHSAHPATQRIGYGRAHNSSVTARVSGGLSSIGFIGNGTSGQKLSTAANITTYVTAPSRPLLIVSSTSSVANRTTVNAGSTAGTQITSKSSASQISVGKIATPSATIGSSSNAGGLQFRGAGSRLRGLELLRLLGCLTVCMMIGARIFV